MIVLCRRNVPIAEIRAIARPTGERPIGLARGEFEIPEAFFAPLPEDIVDSLTRSIHRQLWNALEQVTRGEKASN